MGTRTALLRTDRNYCHRMSVAHLYPQAPQWSPRDHRGTVREGPSSLARGSRVLLVDTRGNEPLRRHRPLIWPNPTPSASNGELKRGLPPPRFTGPRVRHRARSPSQFCDSVLTRKDADYCHLMVMVTRAKATESPAPSLGPRTIMITPFAFRNRATPIPPAMAPPALRAI
jgi:hypothetical protein